MDLKDHPTIRGILDGSIECDPKRRAAINRKLEGLPSGPRPRFSQASQRERVGQALTKLIDGLFRIKGGEGCGCKTLANKMDVWGVDGCERHRAEIVGMLVDNRPMLEKALSASGWFSRLSGWVVGAFVPDYILKLGAGWLLGEAIRNIRNAPPPAKRKNPFKMQPNKQIRFVTLCDYSEDIRRLSSLVPPETTCIAGVARSGLYAATMIAMLHHLPLLTIRQTLNDVVDAGNGFRIGGSSHVGPDRSQVLVIDDTVFTGNSIRQIRPLLDREFGRENYKIATVYKNPNANIDPQDEPDFFATTLPWPHILEWNVFNSILSPSMAVDFDGVLCHECPPGADDDGPKYAEWMANAKPLYTPRRCSIPIIVTARLERYRGLTEEWLTRNNIHWDRLVMHPAATLAERNADDIGAYKAEHFEAWASTHKAAPGPILFVESDDSQAQRIAEITGRHVVCPATASVY
jgi:adenine/guanine phosphoribosyltransferase-like PRPP-binding protein